ncbi:hypothetical protein CTEN210_04783 [Chaetoceros tenuissimus]|uniref:Uncharacterized protein n=1 Tax=Chaetoceros tenuissimus TaxID=426638 RepID=A0AAD3CLM1_9STRA|nr:hypothetical protein CTEN210_04783 [Chaetoceros tenuissimus]
MQPIVEKYEQLPPQGKFGVASIGGFVGTKISIRSTGKLLRISGATFLLSEVMHQAGLLDEIAKKGDEFVDINLTAEGENALKGIKQRICSTVNECRMKVRKELNMEKIRSHYQELLEKDKLGTLGFTTGAVFGLLV